MNIAARPVVAEAEPISQGAIALIAAIVKQRTGQEITANRTWRIETALQPILRNHQCASIDELAGRLSTTSDPAFADSVVEAILNYETSFFRDASVLDQVVDAALTLRAEAGNRRFRIWSAGCSTGQEPYSLAILLAERLAADDPAFPEIIATDVSGHALGRARSGRYTQFEIQRGMPIRRMMTWFDSDKDEWVARRDLVRRVQFRPLNLADDFQAPGKFDLILCRNVMLYFSAALRRQVFDRLAGSMTDTAMLVLGAGETVIGQTEALAPCQRFRGFYRRAEMAKRRAD